MLSLVKLFVSASTISKSFLVSTMTDQDVEMRPDQQRTLIPMQWEIFVEYQNEKWWRMPDDLSGPIVEKWREGYAKSSYVWPWHGTREGSYRPEGQPSDFNRYVIDFTTMKQRNSDNGRTRNVLIVQASR